MSTASATKCAMYLRISLDATGEGRAVERQREDCLSIARSRGWEVVEEYVDNSISASDRSKARPAYDRMVEDYRAGRFSAIVCYDLDRLTRQPRQLEDWIEAAEEDGLLLVTANGEADLSTDGGRLFARIKAGVARAEVERKGARQRRALQQRADQGRAPLGVRLTGYRADGSIDESEAAVVRAMFDRFAAGDSLRGIAAWLEQSGHRTRRGGTWSPSSVRTALLNPRYAGRAVYRGEPTGKLGDWEPLVSEALFDTVQGILHDPRRKSNRRGTDRRYLGSGIYRCGECGEPARSHSGSRYRCPDGHVVRSARPVDDFVVQVVTTWLRRPELVDELRKEDAAPEDVGALAALRARLAQIESDYDAGLIDGRRYATASEKVTAQIRQAERDLARRTAAVGLDVLHDDEDPGAAFLAAPLGTQRTIVEQFIDVRLHRAPRGSRTFDPETVTLSWKAEA